MWKQGDGMDGGGAAVTLRGAVDVGVGVYACVGCGCECGVGVIVCVYCRCACVRECAC